MKANYKRRYANKLLQSKDGALAIIDECLETINNYEVLFLYALNHDDVDPFGRKRLIRVYKKMAKARETLTEFYSSDRKDKDIDLFAMREELRSKGIAPEQLDCEVLSNG